MTTIPMSNSVNGAPQAAPSRKANYTAVIALMAVVFVLSIYIKLKPQNSVIEGVDVRTIPCSIGGWTCQDAPTDDALQKQIGADSYLMRSYINPAKTQQVDLYLVYRRYGRREFNHNPDQCFPSGGYRELSHDTTTLSYAGKERQAAHMLFDGSGVLNGQGGTGVPQTTVSYFFASGDKTESVFLKQQAQMALERLIPNKHGWALLRLTSYRRSTDEDALQAQKEFMAVYGQSIHDVLTGKNIPTATAQL
jgi:EpsI family protein